MNGQEFRGWRRERSLLNKFALSRGSSINEIAREMGDHFDKFIAELAWLGHLADTAVTTTKLTRRFDYTADILLRARFQKDVLYGAIMKANGATTIEENGITYLTGEDCLTFGEKEELLTRYIMRRYDQSIHECERILEAVA